MANVVSTNSEFGSFKINLLLVRDNLNVTISLDDFIQLTHGVESVMFEKFDYKPNKYQT